nr:hypothetical protein CcurKRNrm3_p162 [Cryptomonas curvata]
MYTFYSIKFLIKKIMIINFYLKNVRYLKFDYMKKKKKIFQKILRRIMRIWLFFLKFYKKLCKHYKKIMNQREKLIEKVIIFLICNLPTICFELKNISLKKKKFNLKLNKRKTYLFDFFNLFIYYKKVNLISYSTIFKKNLIQVTNVCLIFKCKGKKFSRFNKKKFNFKFFFLSQNIMIRISQLEILKEKFFIKHIYNSIYHLFIFKKKFKKIFLKSKFNKNQKKNKLFLIYLNILNFKKKKVEFRIKKFIMFILIIKFFITEKNEQQIIFDFIIYILKNLKKSKNELIIISFIEKKYLSDFLIHLNQFNDVNFCKYLKILNKKNKILKYQCKNVNKIFILSLLINILNCWDLFFFMLYLYLIFIKLYLNINIDKKNSLFEIKKKLNFYICVHFLKYFYNNFFFK